MLIRPANVQDAEVLLSIYAPYVRNTAVSFETELPTAEEFRERIRGTMKNYPYLVAERDSEIIGYAYAGAFRSRRAYWHTAELSVYIREDCHGLGLGRRFYQELENRLVWQNIYKLYACITFTGHANDPFLTDASLRFHERLGFRTTARFPDCGCKFGRWYGVVWMEKPIGQMRDDPPEFVPWDGK